MCYFHNDMDGIASASIVKKVYPNAKFQAVDYGDDWDASDIINSKCIIVDFSFDNMEELKQYPDILCWIDHHKSAMEKNKELWDSDEIDGLRDITKSGCELTWDWFFPHEKVPRAIELIGDRDMWKFKYGDETRAFHEFVSSRYKEPNIDLLNLKIDSFMDEFTTEDIGRMLLEKKREQINKSFEQGTDIKFHSHKTRLINTNLNVSGVGEYCYKDKGYPIALIWSKRGDKIVCSLRSNTIDVGKIAESHGGGGHKFASGFTLANFKELEKITK